MTSEDFVSLIHESVVEDNLSTYIDMFASIDRKGFTDPHWKRALALYDKLNNDDQNVFFDMIRQVMIDTISNLLAVLDGISHLKGYQGDLTLMASTSTERLNGDLQDRFLEREDCS